MISISDSLLLNFSPFSLVAFIVNAGQPEVWALFIGGTDDRKTIERPSIKHR